MPSDDAIPLDQQCPYRGGRRCPVCHRPCRGGQPDDWGALVEDPEDEDDQSYDARLRRGVALLAQSDESILED